MNEEERKEKKKNLINISNNKSKEIYTHSIKKNNKLKKRTIYRGL